MTLSKLKTNIPKSSKSNKKVLEECIRKKRIKTFSKDDASTFLNKAHYNFEVAEFLDSENYNDWAITAYYFGMYMAAKAFTTHFTGKAARDHGCTIALMFETVQGKRFAKKLEKTRKKMDEEINLLDKVRQYRNLVSYNVTDVSEKEVREIAGVASNFIIEVEKLMEK